MSYLSLLNFLFILSFRHILSAHCLLKLITKSIKALEIKFFFLIIVFSFKRFYNNTKIQLKVTIKKIIT